MRYAKTQREESRERLLAHASERFRRDGISAVGLRSVMADVGMTHGGFYHHFPSRSELIVEAVDLAFGQTADRLTQSLRTAAAGQELEALVETYLGERHRSDPGNGCPAATLAPEVAREGAEARKAFMRGMDVIGILIAEQLPSGGLDCERLDRGRSAFALMVGAMQVARMLDEPAAAATFLAESQRAVLSVARQPWPAPAARTAANDPLFSS